MHTKQLHSSSEGVVKKSGTSKESTLFREQTCSEKINFFTDFIQTHFISALRTTTLFMSSRALKRLERSKALASPEPEPAADEKVEYKPKVNAFAFLNGDSDSESDEKQSEPEPEAPPEPTPKEPTPPARRKKAKKRVKNTSVSDKESDSDLDEFLAEISRRDKAASPTPVAQSDKGLAREEWDDEDGPVFYADSNFMAFTGERLKSCLPLLSIGLAKNLDPDTELKNLFGNLSLEAIEDANNTTSLGASPEVLAQFKKLARLTRGWSGRDHRSVPGTARKLLLTRIKDDWLPTSQRPLSMEELTPEKVLATKQYKLDGEDYALLEKKLDNEEHLGVKYFQFSKIPSMPDRMANSMFYASVVITPAPDALMQLLQQNPYHPETLLQVAMIMRRQGSDKSTSNALVDKALFVFDRSFNKRFHELLLDGHTELLRLPYERLCNRQFYLAMFRLISGLGERSTFFTALTYCKFLLALSPAEDPLGVRYFIDHYAILAEEFQYLVDFVESPLTTTYAQWYTPGLAFSHVLALLHLKKTEAARDALKKAFSAHTYCCTQMLQLIGLLSNVEVRKKDLQKNELTELANETYLARAKILWSDAGHRQFLHDELLALFAQRRDNKLWLLSWFAKEEKSADLPVNLIRFAVLSGENQVLAKVPQQVFDRDDMFEYDVMPPKDDTVAYDVFTGVADAEKATDALLDYVDHNMLSTIVQSRSGAEFENLQFGEIDADGE